MKHKRTYNETNVSRIVECGKCKEKFMSLVDSSGKHSCPYCNYVAEIKLEKAEEHAA